MQDKTFRFPTVHSTFNPDSVSEHNSMITEVKENIIYPYLSDFRMQMHIELEQGIAQKNTDRIGLQYLLGERKRE